MKTTVELPDERAALNGRKLKDLVGEGLQLVLEAPRKGRRQRSLAELVAGVRGVIDSGIPDLRSNPRHLNNLGHDAGDH